MTAGTGVRFRAGGRWALVVAAGLAGLRSPAAPPAPVGPDHVARMTRGLETFQKQVRQTLVQRCLRCHGGKTVESEFDLSDRTRLLRGGTAGPAVVPGKARASLLYQLVTHAQEPHMPHNAKRLSAGEIAHLASWIDDGAPYDGPLVGARETASWTHKRVSETARAFWSFQPLHRAPPPAVRDAAWPRTPIDRFILARLENAGIAPNPPADRRLLIRRAYFDLIGLPPTPTEVEAFVADPAPDAYERLIDRLLDSPHYGERWGRHWLDLARFAESHGFEHDSDRPTAYPYRDFVIQALNDDLPYDTFVRWQLAGDELAPDNRLALAATGFLAAGVHSTQITKNEVEKHRYDELDDMLATTGTALLGLTVGCARCHDHKFDPIPQRDYYGLLASFTTTVRTEVEIDPDPAAYARARAVFDREHAPLAAALKAYEAGPLTAHLAAWEKSRAGVRAPAAKPAKVPAAARAALDTPPERRTPAQRDALLAWYKTIDPHWQRLNRQVQEHLAKAPVHPKALIASEGLPPLRLHTQGADFFPQTYFLRCGDPAQKEGVAGQGFLQVLMTAPGAPKRWKQPPPAGWRTSYRRRALAAWVSDVEGGAGRLLARVIVNRLWQHHLGRGIVSTPSDFGTRGERPTHPELLDWLATELIRNGWRLKPIHRLIMTSATYCQSSHYDPARGGVDRDGRLVWRRPPHRLEAEVLRDALLAVGGQLEPRLFGPGTLDDASRRRSIYFTVKRSKLVPMMQVFDAPDALQGIGERPTTTIAPQALLLLNNPHVRGYAAGFARRVAPGPDTAVEDAIRTAYLAALARPPAADELADGAVFVRQQAEAYRAAGRPDARELALTDFCQTLFCLNEFAYVD